MLPGLVRLAFLFSFFTLPAQAGDHAAVDRLLAQEQAPPGVVFEVVTGDERALEWAVPRIADHARRLRARFPDVDIVIVSHGREMFALRRSGRAGAPAVHGGIERLVREQAVTVHVCGTYAAWRGVPEEAFPEYVNVAPEGPAQFKAYEALGYMRVRLSAPAGEAGTAPQVK